MGYFIWIIVCVLAFHFLQKVWTKWTVHATQRIKAWLEIKRGRQELSQNAARFRFEQERTHTEYLLRQAQIQFERENALMLHQQQMLRIKSMNKCDEIRHLELLINATATLSMRMKESDHIAVVQKIEAIRSWVELQALQYKMLTDDSEREEATKALLEAASQQVSMLYDNVEDSIYGKF